MKKSKKTGSKGLLIAIIAAALIVGGSIVYTENQENEDANVVVKNGEEFIVEMDEPVTLTIVSDEACEECDTEKLKNWLKPQVGGTLAVRYLEYSSAEGKTLVGEYGGTYLPFMLLGEEIQEKANIGHIEHHIATKVKDRYLVDLEKMGAPIGKYLNMTYFEKDDPNAPKIVAVETKQDLGEVMLSGGKVATSFLIKNEGKSPLTFIGLDISCGCTSAKVQTSKGESPVYLMAGHGESVKWNGELAPGEEGRIIAFYDPTVHPELEGDVIREITVKTNDPINPKLTLQLYVKQVPN